MFEQRIKELRKRNNMTQVQLANKLGVSKGTVAMWETGQRRPGYDMLIKICAVFDKRIDYVLGHSDDESPFQFTQQQVDDIEYKSTKINLYKIATRYLALDEYGKKTIEHLVDTEYDRCVEQDTLRNPNQFIIDIKKIEY